MNNEFGKIISFLRKEKGLSQKKVATDLGISQALLSHYEKGIRECGLDFLVRIADYFDVSTDYLLSRTTNPKGANAELIDITETDEESDEKNNISNTYCLINRKVIINTTSLIYNILSDIDSKKLSKYVSEYLMAAEYSVFRQLYSLCDNEQDESFTVPIEISSSFCNTSMDLDLAKIKKLGVEQKDKIKMELSPRIIAQKYSENYSSLHNLIRNVEKNLKSKFKI